MQEQLILTDDQVGQIRPILKAKAESRIEILVRYRSQNNIWPVDLADRMAMPTNPNRRPARWRFIR